MTEYIFREVHYGYTDGTALGRMLEKQEKVERNAAMIAMRRRGETYKAIGNQFGTSPQAARFVCMRDERRKKRERDELLLAIRAAAGKLGLGDDWHAMRVYECLRRNGIRSVPDLQGTPDAELMNMRGFGKVSLEIARAVEGVDR